MLISVGHGRLNKDELLALLQQSSIDEIVDIRRFPGSRHNPDVGSDAMTQWVAQGGIRYRTDPRLGGRRRLPADTVVEDSWWRVQQFAAYAAHTRTPEFTAAVRELLDSGGRTAMMCSESVWWRCHRRLVADVVVMRWNAPVEHLMHTGRLTPHSPAAGARIRADGHIIWDGDSDRR